MLVKFKVDVKNFFTLTLSVTHTHTHRRYRAFP